MIKETLISSTAAEEKHCQKSHFLGASLSFLNTSVSARRTTGPPVVQCGIKEALAVLFLMTKWIVLGSGRVTSDVKDG